MIWKSMSAAAIAALISTVTHAEVPPIGPPYHLPGDLQQERVAGRQEGPAIAEGNDGYLVVWADNRSSLFDLGVNGAGVSGPYFGPQLGSMFDIYASRLDANGQVVDVSPIIVSQAQYNQTPVKVAWNGRNWLVVWMTERESDRDLMDLMATRVSPSGAVLDDPPLLIDSGATMDQHNPWSVTSDGTNWTIVWRDLSPTAGGIFTIDGARISPAGVNLDPGGKRLHVEATNTAPTAADLAWAGDEYLLTFVELSSSGWAVRAKRLTPALEPLGATFTVNLYSPSEPAAPAVASNGTEFLITWFEKRYPEASQLFAARVAHDGTVLDPAGIELTEYAGNTQFDPDVTWDGTTYVVAHNRNNDIYTTRVTSSGAVVDPPSTLVKAGPGAQVQPAIVPRPGGGAQVVWNDHPDRADIMTASVSASGAPSAEVAVSLGAPRQSHPRMAAGGDGFLVVFRSQISEEARIMAQRLDVSGAPLDAEPSVVAVGSDLRNPSVAWNGIDYYIVWEDPTEGRGQVYGRRMRADGTFVDAALSLLPGNMPDVAALDTTFLVVVSWEIYIKRRYAHALRVGADGAPIGSLFRIGQHYDVWPRVTAAGNRWLAVWQQRVTHDNPRSLIAGAFIAADGTPTERFDISDHNYRATPHLAHGANSTLVTWSDHDIFGRRIQDDGTLLDTAAGIVISGAPGDQFTPSVAWDGAQWIVDWLDHRNETYPKQPRGDVYATRVDANGVVLDLNGFPVAISELPEDTPTIVAGNGIVLFGYTAFKDQSPYKNLRITLRASGLQCRYSVTPTSVTVGPESGSGTVALTLENRCPWSATTSDPWLTPTPDLGVGSGVVTYSFRANEGAGRTGTITIGETIVTITQEDGCTWSVSPESVEIDAAGGSASSFVTTGATCPWTASTGDSWITITPTKGEGSSVIELAASANNGAARSGTIIVGGKTIVVRQAAAVPPDPPQNVLANATSTTQVNVSWSAVANATSYEIARSVNGSAFVVIASRSTPLLIDAGLTPSTSYLYKVRAVTASGTSTFCAPDAATTIAFQDETIHSQSTPIRAVHVEQLRIAVNALRRSAALPGATFSDNSLVGTLIRAAHIQELRDALAEARNALGLAPIAFGRVELRSTATRAADIEEIRSGVR